MPLTEPAPTEAEIGRLVQAYYDNLSEFAGAYLMLDYPTIQIQRQDGGQLPVCVAYVAAAITAPDTVVGTNVRLFTLAQASDGTWQVAQMGDSDSSCSA